MGGERQHYPLQLVQEASTSPAVQPVEGSLHSAGPLGKGLEWVWSQSWEEKDWRVPRKGKEREYPH